MRIAFITPSVSRTAGGIFEIERRLGQSLNEIPNTFVSVYGLRDKYTEADLPSWWPLKPRAFPVNGLRGFGYSSALMEALQQEAADIAHLHVMWMFTSVVIHRWSKSRQRPYLVTPNGMLEPWALRNSTWKKRIAGLLYERNMLDEAACIQANTEKEAADIRSYGLKNPIAIIPNGIDLPAEMAGDRCQVSGSGKQLKTENRNPPWAGFIEPGRKVLLFLSRIHPKKGLINLLKAWAALEKSEARRQKSEWILAIAGWDQGEHEAELKRLCLELQIRYTDVRDRKADNFQPSVLFLGPQFNEAKMACYQNCDAFILPSFSEGLPMAVLEAWAYGKPVLMTPECNLPEGFAANAAIRVEQGAESIARGLEDLFHHPPSAIRHLGDNGRQLVATRFAWPKVARDMKMVYDWVLGNRPKPECIILS